MTSSHGQLKQHIRKANGNNNIETTGLPLKKNKVQTLR